MKEQDGRQGTKPSKASEPDPPPDNRFFSLHYACQYGGKTDEKSEYSKIFIERCLLDFK
jgi:hypothetical protein